MLAQTCYKESTVGPLSMGERSEIQQLKESSRGVTSEASDCRGGILCCLKALTKAGA